MKNTKVVLSSVSTVFVWIFVIFHVCGKIFLSCQQFLPNCRRSWFIVFPWFAGSSWKNTFFEHVCEHTVCKWCLRVYTQVQVPLLTGFSISIKNRQVWINIQKLIFVIFLRKFSKQISYNFEKYIRIFQKILRSISENF